jgi:hypothetical protein
MATPVLLPTNQAKFLDPDGTINKVWMRFLQTLTSQAGGISGIIPVTSGGTGHGAAGAATANAIGALAEANNLSDLSNDATARTNLGLGSIAVENSPLALSKGGTGDGTNFSWTGASKTLIANTVTSDGSGLSMTSPAPAVNVNSGQVLLQSGNVTGTGSSGNVTLAAGNATAGAAGDVRMQAGAVTSGGAGVLLFQAGAATSGIAGEAEFFGGNCTTGTSGPCIIKAGNASTSGIGGDVQIVAGNSVTGTCGDVTITGGQSPSGPGGSSKIGNVSLTVGFSGAASGKASLINSFSNPVVQISDDGVHSGGTLGFYGATPVLQPTGYGTPTNGAHQASFDATTITLINLAKAVAQLIIDLKSEGILGA